MPSEQDVPGQEAVERSVVDLTVLTSWMDEQGLGAGPLSEVTALAGGTQNVLLRFTRDGRSYVLRRGPKHLRPKSNDAMRREARVLAALEGSDVPHPGLIAACDDETVMNGAAFYLMEPIDGFNPSTGLPALHAGNAGIQREMTLNAARALAALGRVDHVAVGLGDVGNPDGFLDRQVPRWLDELDGYRSFAGYDGPDLPDVDRVAAWLTDNQPATWTPGIMHGDYHLANLLFRHDGPEVAAIVDWEMVTIGDPLLDLGWLIATGKDDEGRPLGIGGPLAAAEGTPGPAQVVAAYGEGSARDLSSVPWYAVMACFKLGIVLEGTNARAAAGKAPKPIGDMLHATAVALLQRASSLIRKA
ncbi:MAG TPA: phosphotransferase family protein [Acidimicrobiales bacterium]|jgi:aminoglycoside phosphotransferase (APT) family kinase protein|nr:phosphotransferase family protein [Acidimicrobiales bacterium]